MHSANDGKSLDRIKWKIPILNFFFSDKEKCMCLWVFYFDEAANGCELPGGHSPCGRGAAPLRPGGGRGV